LPALTAISCHIAKQLGLQDILSFLVFLARLECLIVLPAHGLVALSAGNIPHDVSACGHIPLTGIARRDVDDVVEKVSLPMLAPEISAYDIFMVREMRLAVLAAVDLVTVQVDVVGEPHGLDSSADCADGLGTELMILDSSRTEQVVVS